MNRCKNCGWDNPNEVLVCEKCKRTLSGTITNDQVDNNNTVQSSDDTFNPKKTLVDSMNFGERNCSSCGYPLRHDVTECPKCGSNVDDSNVKKGDVEVKINNSVICMLCGEHVNDSYAFCPNCGNKLKDYENPIKTPIDYSKTVRPNRLSKRYNCSLTMMMDEGEKGEPSIFEFSGQSEIILNRENTESENMTITSKEQACLIYENSKWYIIDKSAMETTFVRAVKKMEITDGDVIMMGDRRFKFNTNE